MSRKPRLEKGGLILVPLQEFQSFSQRVSGQEHKRRYLIIRIPKDIARYLTLKRGNLVEVAIRKVNEKYVVEKYRGLPITFKPVRYPFPHSATCPFCGEVGLVLVNWKKQFVSIKIKGNPHYISTLNIAREDYPEIIKIVKKMRKYRENIEE